MDASDWFVDTPVPADLRALVDTVLKPRFDALADQLKDSLNLWTGDALDLEQTQLYQTISAFAGAMSTVSEGVEAYAGMMQTLVHATTRIGVGFVPVVGPTLDLCEAVTGKEWCLPAGRELSDEERIFSGLGVLAAAAGPFWRGAKGTAVTPDAIRVAGEIAEVDEVIIQGLKLRSIGWYKGLLKGAVTEKTLEPFEKTAAKFLSRDVRALLGVGDDGVRVVLWRELSDKVRANLKAPDFLTVSAQNKLILSEVKMGRNVPGDKVIEQLSSGMEGLRTKGLVGDVEEAQLIMERGGKFDGKQYIAKDTYLFDTQKGKRATLNGFNIPIRVIRL
ncbi:MULTISPECIES: hypothetical protein [Sorangium]|nr:MULTISPECIES: hypothetical protein [Sorangium]